MRCEEIMKRVVECVSPRDTVQSAALKMRDENVGFLPVCDQNGAIMGTITDRDLAIRALAEARQPATPIEQVMTREVIACHPEDDLRQAEDMMMRRHKSRIMCTDRSGKLVGVISLSDIARREEATRAAEIMASISEREAS